ncbi:MAG TPA: hypothetical protein VE978_26280 [Chitinophagales bacterium]|nr:hypothetical protein [Chitinophagales bacterium]
MNQSIRIFGNWVEATLQVLFLQEKGFIIAFSPALQLSAYGHNVGDAKAAFETTIKIFFQELVKDHELTNELVSLGWKSNDHEFHRESFLQDLFANEKIPITILQQQSEHFRTTIA